MNETLASLIFFHFPEHLKNELVNLPISRNYQRSGHLETSVHFSFEISDSTQNRHLASPILKSVQIRSVTQLDFRIPTKANREPIPETLRAYATARPGHMPGHQRRKGVQPNLRHFRPG